jgi:hypothetical protein
MSLLAKSITRSALNVQVWRKPARVSRKDLACNRTDNKVRATKVFKFDSEGVCVAINVVKPHSKYRKIVSP